MGNHLVRMTEKDYKDYKNSMSKIEYSIKCNESSHKLIPSQLIREISEATILKEEEFIELINKSIHEFYFFKNACSEIIGIVVLSIQQKTCTINEFCVFETQKGYGTELLSLVVKTLQLKRIKYIELFCPFAGAQQFWKKKGFSASFTKPACFEIALKYLSL